MLFFAGGTPRDNQFDSIGDTISILDIVIVGPIFKLIQEAPKIPAGTWTKRGTDNTFLEVIVLANNSDLLNFDANILDDIRDILEVVVIIFEERKHELKILAGLHLVLVVREVLHHPSLTRNEVQIREVDSQEVLDQQDYQDEL